MKRILVGVFLTASMWGQSAMMADLLQKARALEGRGRMDLAAQTWQQVLLADPNQREALANLARVAKQAGRDKEAEKYLARLRVLNPADTEIARVEATNRLEEVRPRLEEAARLARNDQPLEAMAIYRNVFGDAPPPGEWSIAYYETEAATPEGFQHAAAGLERLVRQYPANDAYRFALGRLFTYRAETRARGMEILSTISPTSTLAPQAKQAWRQALIWNGTNQSNRAAIRAYTQRYPDVELKALEAKIPNAVAPAPPTGFARNPAETAAFEALSKADTQEADRLFTAVLTENPSSFGGRVGLGYVRMRQLRFGEAAENFGIALETEPLNPELLQASKTARLWQFVQEGTEALAEGSPTFAETAFRKALALEPDRVEAQRGLAGALLAMGKAKEAIEWAEKVVVALPGQAPAWDLLVTAHHKGSGAKAAIAAANRIPPAARLDLTKDLLFLSGMVEAYDEIGDREQSRRAVAETLEAAEGTKQILPAHIQLQFAGLYLKWNQLSLAETYYRAGLDSNRYSVDGWEGLLAAVVKQAKDKAAAAAIADIPSEVMEELEARPGFLRLAAAIESKAGRLSDAEKHLRQALEAESDKPSLDTQIQLSAVWLEQGYPARAERLLFTLVDQFPQRADVWKMLLVALMRSDKTKEAADVLAKIPGPVTIGLEDDPGFATAVAGVQNATGNYVDGLALLRRMMDRERRNGNPISADVRVQYAWLLFNSGSDETDLYDTLVRLRAETDLSDQQVADTREIWSLWSRARAEAARKAGNFGRAVEIMEAAIRLLPRDTKVLASLAGVLLESGDSERSLQLFKSWGLTGAQPYDYNSAVGAAIAQKDAIAWTWIAAGLKIYPQEPDLLQLAGQMAASEGKYQQAVQLWQAAVTALQLKGKTTAPPASLDPVPALQPDSNPGKTKQPPARVPAAPTPQRVADPASKLGTLLLLGGSSLASPRMEPALFRAADQPRILLAQSTPSESAQALSPDVSALIERAAPSAVDRLAPGSGSKSKEQELLEDRIAAVRSRNTPFIRSTIMVGSRSGRAGFEQRVLQESEFSASLVASNKLRATLVVRPTFLSTAASDITNTELRFGLAPKTALIPSSSVAGLGAELQLSTNTFGLRVGSSPRGFLIQNLIGNIRLRPANGPVTFTFSRDSIRDTALSFAGARDPVTQQIFGGAIATGGQIQGSWGTRKSGFYIGGGYQQITGRRIDTNRRMDASAGTYWQVMEGPDGRLQAGFSVFMMGYSKNLRYFTLGHGGYFSPQRYFATGIPLTWTGTKNHWEYKASGTLGVQYFREESAALFPLDQALQAATRQTYAGRSTMTLNFDADVRVLYKATSNLQIGLFAAANNSRNFSAQSVGFTVTHSFRALSMRGEEIAPSVPDWQGNPPMGLR